MRRLALLFAILAGQLACTPWSDGPEHSRSATTGVTVYDPERAWNGFTLAFEARRHPVLLDMRGEVVHAWPEARLKGRARLLADCSILGLSTGRGVSEYDWLGNKTWGVQFEGRFPHHDIVRLDNGHTLVLTKADDSEADDVLELDRAGDVVWEWRAAEALAQEIRASTSRDTTDRTHINSVQELPDNPWFQNGDERFRPGNLLLSARNLDLILIVDKATKAVVWRYRGELDLQHEALMIGPGSERSGNILVFNNRYGSFRTDRRSEVLELDPRDGSVVWSYSAPGFFSETIGLQQPLPNGNVMVASSLGPRLFEVDRSGRTVWEWVAPYRLSRPGRYAPDHCPELAALGSPAGRPVRPGDYQHVDRDSYAFARGQHREKVTFGDVERQVLRPHYRCAPVTLPPQARMKLRYGVDRRRIETLGLSSYAADFSVTLRNQESGVLAVVFEDTVDLESLDWRERVLDLSALANRGAEICVETAERGRPEGLTERLAYWGTPSIVAGEAGEDEESGPDDLTPEELEVRLEHLRAMGYVD